MKRLVFAFVSVFFVLATIITISYAWFINSNFEEPDVSGYSYAAYFASGNGSEDDPYTITNKRHLYNLAWLQYLGNFNELEEDNKTISKQYYFQISHTVKEIDMTGYSLPPIGTETYPFIGVFNGNECVVKNLNITNNFNDFEDKHPKSNKVTATAIAELNIIGMFGVVGNYNTMYNISSYVPSIQNFYLDDVTISSIAKQSLVGLVAGYVAPSGNITNIGVHYSKFKLASGISKISDFDNISNYALIGDYDSEKIGWEDKPSAGGSGGGNGGDGIGYGGSFDVQKYETRLSLIYENQSSSAASPYFPTMESATSIAKGEILPLTVSNTITSATYAGAQAKETVSNENIGYFSGNQNKLTDHTLEFVDYTASVEGGKTTYSWEDGCVPNTFFTRTGQNATATSENIFAMTDEEIAALPDGVKNLIPETNTTVNYTTIRLQQRFESTGPATDGGKFNVKDSISYYNQNYTSVYLPNNGIWFKPKIAGKFRFVVYSGSNGKNFTLYKISRGTSKAEGETEEEFLQRHFSTATLNGSDLNGSSMGNNKYFYTYELPLYCLFYFEYDVTSSDLNDNVEFLIGNDRGSGAYFLYLDIGTNAGEGEEGGNGGNTDTPTYSGSLSSIDFVSATGSTLEDISADNYVSSNVLFALSNVENVDASTADVVFYFRRKKFSSGEYTDVVLYYIDPRTLDSNGDPTNESNGLKLTPSGTGSKAHASSTKCNNYVGGASNDEEIISSTTTAYNNLNAAVSAGTISNNSESLALINELESCLSDWESLDDTSSASITTAQITALLTTANNQYDTAHIKSLIDSINDNLTVQTITSSDETSIINAYSALNNASAEVKSLVGESYISKCNSSYELLQSAYVTVTFHVEDDTTQIKMLPTSTLSESKAPTIDTELYDFDGWYTDSAFNNAYTFGSAVGNESIDLYAKVSQKTIVVFKLNEVELSRVTKSSGATLEDSDFPSIDSEQYYFNGWFDESGNEYTSGSTVSGNVILTADVDNKYTVTFVYNNGSSNTTAYADRTGIVSEPTNPIHSNSIAVFNGWYSNEGLTQQFDFTSAISSNITLYAKWTYEAEVVFNLNGGNISGSTDNVVLAVDSATGIPVLPNESSMSNGDLSFAGWYIDQAGDNKFDTTTAVTSSTTTVYAKWVEEAGVTVYFKIGYRFNDSNEAEAKYLTVPAIDSSGTLLVSIDDLKTLVLEHAGQNEANWKIGVLYETYFQNEIDLTTDTNAYMTNGYLDLSKLGTEGTDTIDGQSGASFYYVTIKFVAAS